MSPSRRSGWCSTSPGCSPFRLTSTVLLVRIAEACTELLSCERASIFLHDPKTGDLWTKVALKSPPIRAPSHVGIVGHAFTHNQVVQVLEPYLDPRFNAEPDRRSGFVTRNLLARRSRTSTASRSASYRQSTSTPFRSVATTSH